MDLKNNRNNHLRIQSGLAKSYSHLNHMFNLFKPMNEGSRPRKYVTELVFPRILIPKAVFLKLSVALSLKVS